MNKLIIIFLFTICAFQLKAQKDWLKNIDHGVVLKYSSDIYSDYNRNPENSFEGGKYFLLNFTKRKKVSAEIRAGYSQATLGYDQIVNWLSFNTFFIDTIDMRKSRSGSIDYKNINLNIPVTFRYQLNKKNSGLHLSAGMIHYFSLWNSSNWKFDEYLYDYENWPDAYTLIEENLEEKLDFNLYHLEIVGGIGFKRKKVMVDFLISGGDIFIDDSYIRRLVKLSTSLNIYYQLN